MACLDAPKRSGSSQRGGVERVVKDVSLPTHEGVALGKGGEGVRKRVSFGDAKEEVNCLAQA